ncbi:hypothetical protein PROVRETT_09604 [Providencia rettgeri DSM 1131]|nr:hypothetical protein PROVRETT_09604 [Providencia rettgeri DSM 1131]
MIKFGLLPTEAYANTAFASMVLLIFLMFRYCLIADLNLQTYIGLKLNISVNMRYDMRLFIIVFAVMLSACASSGRELSKENPKDDPYVDSTLNSIKAGQNIQIERKMRRGY